MYTVYYKFSNSKKGKKNIQSIACFLAVLARNKLFIHYTKTLDHDKY